MMKKEHKKETLPVSTLKTFQKIEAVEKEQINVLEELQSSIKMLSQKVDRSVDVNITLQTRIADLMATITEMAENFKEIARFLRGSARPEDLPTIEEQREAMAPSIEPVIGVRETVSRPDITLQLKELVSQNRELTETLRSLETELKKTSTKEAIKKALEKSHVK